LAAYRLFAGAVLVAALLLLGGCGGGDDTPSPPAPDPGGATAVPSGTTSGTTTATAAADTAAVAPISGRVTVVAKDNFYEPSALVVRTGEPVTLTLRNEGAAIHDWKVLRAKDAEGKDIGTKLLPNGQSETITFTLVTTGTFDFYCEVHPVEMRGRLTVR
jgi:plastocyanin